jgi:hypothetical protein
LTLSLTATATATAVIFPRHTQNHPYLPIRTMKTKKNNKPITPTTTTTTMQELTVDMLRTVAAGALPREECKK